MKLYLGGDLNFYHPHKDRWLQFELDHPTPLVDILNAVGIPLGEVYLVVLNGEKIDIQDALIAAKDEVKIYPAVGGG
jgi:molybdopterin converting factor small subunit